MPLPPSASGAPTATAGALSISLTLNGNPVEIVVDPRERLLDTLRYRLGLPGAKEGCGEGECGACTVLLDGLPVNSCLVPTFQVRGRDVRSIESIALEKLEPMLRCGATQCGACTPGVVMTACWIHGHPELHGSHPLRELMAGNLCRCTGYDGIIDGLRAWIDGEAAAERSGGTVGEGKPDASGGDPT